MNATYVLSPWALIVNTSDAAGLIQVEKDLILSLIKFLSVSIPQLPLYGTIVRVGHERALPPLNLAAIINLRKSILIV